MSINEQIREARLHRLCGELDITPVTPAGPRAICSLHAIEGENARLREEVDALRRDLAILRAAMVEADALTVSPPPKGEL